MTSHPDLGKLVNARRPAWVWSRDGAELLWANPAGGQVFGASSLAELTARPIGSAHPLRRELANLGRTLAGDAALARLRLSADFTRTPVSCRVRRIRLEDGRRGMLVEDLEAEEGGKISDEEVERFFAVGIAADPGQAIGDPTQQVRDDAPPPAASLDLPSGDPAAQASGPEAETSTPADQQDSLLPDWVNSGFALPEQGSRPTAPSPAQGAPPAAPAAVVPPTLPEAEPAKSAAENEAQPAARVVDPATATPAPVSKPGAGKPGTPAAKGPEIHVVRRSPASTVPSEPPPREAPDGERAVFAGRVARELSRKPVRFLWQTDAADRFLFVSPGLFQVVGRSADVVGERWTDVAERLRLDPPGRVARALAQRDTWSGQTAWWPVEGSGVRIPAELTALPVFGADRSFQGYRGFGVLRPAEALMPAGFDARFGSAEGSSPHPAPSSPPDEESVAPASGNVVPIRADLERIPDPSGLSAQERSAFEEIASALRRRIAESLGESPGPAQRTSSAEDRDTTGPKEVPFAADGPAAEPESLESAAQPAADPPPSLPSDETGVLSARDDESRTDESEASGEDGLPAGPLEPPPVAEHQAGPAPLPQPREDPRAADRDLERRLEEMTAILDTATDGILILDATGTIENANASAEALFGLEASELTGMLFVDLLTEASRIPALDYLGGLKEHGVASLLNEGREVEARVGTRSMPLFMTLGRISREGGGRYCALLRDLTNWKRTEAELIAARRKAEAASSQKSDFLARVSHEIRTPLNAVIGFAEVMIEERFGPIGNDRYRDYLRDIRMSGEHVVSLVNDLLDISKIEAGKLDLNLAAVPLNDLVRECITLMQPQASRAHVVLRSSLSREVPGIVADERTMRQIVLNLLSNSVKFTGPGGQVIASTSLAESGEAILRIRDTGEGMSEEELARALEPFRQISTSPMGSGTGTGLGLPLTKALVEANRASFEIRSARGEGTVVKVTFPPTRVLSE